MLSSKYQPRGSTPVWREADQGNKTGETMQKKDGPVVTETGVESQGWQATTRSQEGPRMMAEAWILALSTS